MGGAFVLYVNTMGVCANIVETLASRYLCENKKFTGELV